MREEKTEVTAYSGYRGEESPKTFVRQGKSIAVVEIVKRWIEEEAGKRKRRRFFEVRGSEAPCPQGEASGKCSCNDNNYISRKPQPCACLPVGRGGELHSP